MVHVWEGVPQVLVFLPNAPTLKRMRSLLMKQLLLNRSVTKEEKRCIWAVAYKLREGV